MYRLPPINRDPTFLPVRVRVYIGVTAVAMFAVLFAFKCDAWHKLAGCGLIIGIFGSVALYWETIAGDAALESVSTEISRMSSRKLSFSEVNNIIVLSYLSIFFFFIIFPAVLLQLKSGHISGFRAVSNVGMVLVFSALYPTFFYLFIKTARFFCSVWFKKFQRTLDLEPIVKVKHLLRTTGFVSLSLSGVMQLPATLL